MSTVDFRAGIDAGQDIRGIQAEPAAAHPDHFPDGQFTTVAHGPDAVGEQAPSAPASTPTTPMHAPPVLAGNTDFPGGHGTAGAQSVAAVGELKQPAPASCRTMPKLPSLVLAPFSGDEGPVLALLADILDDLERTRIANENRLRQLTRTETDKDGEERGFGLTVDMPQVAAVSDLVEALGKLEHQSTLQLQRALRKHPLGAWVKATIGIGEKQGARLIAAIGDPYWNTLYDRPRLVSELWAYCGLHVLPAAHRRPDAQTTGDGGAQLHPGHGPSVSQTCSAGVIKQGDPGHSGADLQTRLAGVAPSRARGQKANWSAAAKMRAYLIAESCVKAKARSPYGPVYDDGRTKYASAIHQVDCRRCGPSGKPALAGSPLSAGHQHARAMRLVMKAILKDLWLEAKRLHEDGVVQ